MKLLNNDEFIKKARLVHGDEFDYSNSVYVNTRTKIEILCNKHGSFFTLPNAHLSHASKCPTCWREKRRDTDRYREKLRPKNSGKYRKTVDIFINDFKEIHSDTYDYSLVECTRILDKIKIICNTHGIFEITAKSHLNGAGCGKCANDAHGIKCRKTQEDFVKNANLKHHNKYDYSLVEYVHGKTKVKIVCRSHGEFVQRPENHLCGNGCPKCYDIRRRESSKGGYSFEYFSNYPDRCNVPAMIYVAEIHNKSDHFYKIGITIHNVKRRFYNKKSRDMDIATIIEYKTTLFDAFSREQELLKILKPYQYFPNYKFNGSTECVKVNGEVKVLVENYFDINIK